MWFLISIILCFLFCYFQIDIIQIHRVLNLLHRKDLFFPERKIGLVISKNYMVNHRDSCQHTKLLHPACKCNVLLRGFQVAAWMVVEQKNGSGIR